MPTLRNYSRDNCGVSATLRRCTVPVVSRSSACASDHLPYHNTPYLAVCFPRPLVLVTDDVAVRPPLVHALDDVFLRDKTRPDQKGQDQVRQRKTRPVMARKDDLKIWQENKNMARQHKTRPRSKHINGQYQQDTVRARERRGTTTTNTSGTKPHTLRAAAHRRRS